MKIETTKQIESTTLLIGDRLEIEIDSTPKATFIRLIPRTEGVTFLNVADWEGQIRCITIEAANQAVLERIMNPDPNIPF